MSDRPSLWRRPLGKPLIVSLALNAFLVALIVGAVLARPPHGGRGGPQAAAIRAVLADASPETRAVAKDLRQARRDAFRAQRQAHRAAWGDLRAALMAAPFDPQAFQDAQAVIRERRAAGRAMLDEGLLTLVSAMAAEERAALAAEFEKRFQRRRPPRAE